STAASHTANGADMVLLRQVYGDSTGNVAGSNGPTSEQVAAIVNPNGAGVPRMFKVYLGTSTVPWDWALGPIPVAQLQNVSKIEVTLTATSGKQTNGRFEQASMSTTVFVKRV